MSSRQWVVIRVGTAVMLLLALFPPWRVESYAGVGNGTTPCDFRAGHAFLLRPPDHVAGQPTLGEARIDLPQLLAEGGVVAALTLLACSFFVDVRRPDTRPPDRDR